MLLRIVRDLTSDEVASRIRQFEKETGMTFEKLEEHFLGQKQDAALSRVYFEWAELVNSYKGYLEEGQVDYTVEEVQDFKPEQMALLTPRRTELLYQLAALRAESINDLAKKTRRNVKNVHQDLQVLSRLGFVKLSHRKGKAIVPETLVREIAMLIR